MFKGKYYYDKKSLSYKKIRITKIRVLKVFLSYFFPIIFLSFIICVLVFAFYESPREKKAKSQNKLLIEQRENLLKKMSERIDKLEMISYEIGERDDNIYRAILGEKPIGESIRNAGFGGVDRYKKYEEYESSELVIEVQKKNRQIN